MNIPIALMKEFVTPRLILTNLTETDAKFIHKLTNTNGWIKYIGDMNIHSENDAVDYIKKINNTANVKYWKVDHRVEKASIGIITFIKRDYLDYFDIGFAFLPNFTKKGYAFEATKIVLDKALHETKNECIYALTQPDNSKSINLLKKLGMCFDKNTKRAEEDISIFSISSDQQAINELINCFFNIFNNKDLSRLNLKKVFEICIPQTVIIKKEGINHEVYNLNTFIEPRERILRDGTLTNFEEYEIGNETKIIGNIAQRHSKYHKKGIHIGVEFQQVGNKLFQFIKLSQGWKISSRMENKFSCMGG